MKPRSAAARGTRTRRRVRAHITVVCLLALAGSFGLAYSVATALEEVGKGITIPGFDTVTR